MKRYDLKPNRKVTNKLMQMIMKEHDLSYDDYMEFIDTYGKKEVYETNDIRHFLGY